MKRGKMPEYSVEDNTLTVYIKRLREKLGDAANIETVRGLGYRVD
jgi:DNA-binding response OmpR family regulator